MLSNIFDQLLYDLLAGLGDKVYPIGRKGESDGIKVNCKEPSIPNQGSINRAFDALILCRVN